MSRLTAPDTGAVLRTKYGKRRLTSGGLRVQPLRHVAHKPCSARPSSGPRCACNCSRKRDICVALCVAAAPHTYPAWLRWLARHRRRWPLAGEFHRFDAHLIDGEAKISQHALYIGQGFWVRPWRVSGEENQNSAALGRVNKAGSLSAAAANPARPQRQRPHLLCRRGNHIFMEVPRGAWPVAAASWR